MVDSAAGSSSHLLKTAQNGRGLAGIEDTAASACDCVDILPRERGDATEPLHEVQGDALALEQSARTTADGCDDAAPLQAGATPDRDAQVLNATAPFVDQRA